MKILIVGGSGMVGTFIYPYISKHHEIKILDINEPKISECEFIQGSVNDENALIKALDGTDCFINLTMKNPQGGSSKNQTIEDIKENYELNNKGLHMLLFHAQKMGVLRGIHTSTMSVHHRDPRSLENNGFYHSEESVNMDTPSVYGLTKSFGERICDYFCRWFDMNIIALRITGPRNKEDWAIQVKRSINDNGEYLGGDNYVLGLKNTYRRKGFEASFTPMIGVNNLGVKDYDTDKVEVKTTDFMSEFAALNGKINTEVKSK